MQRSASSAAGIADRSISGTSGRIEIRRGIHDRSVPLLATSSPWSGRTDALVVALIAGFGAIFWLPYSVHAYFLFDDFPIIEHYELGTPLAAYQPTYHPTFRVAMTVAYWVFGQNAEGYYVLLGILMAAAGALMYLALRMLGLSWVPSAIAAVGMLVYPRGDSMGLWWSNPSALAVVFGLASVALGAVWVQRSGRGLRYLVPCLVLLAVSVLSYESFFPIVLLYVCLLPLSPNIHRSIVVIGLSFAAATLSALYLFIGTASHQQEIPISQYAHHAWLLLTGSWQAFGVHGFYGPTAVGTLLLVCCFALIFASLVLTVLPIAEPREPWKRLAFTLTLLIFTVPISLVPFLPSPDYYVPTLATTGNRVNSLPQIFIVAALAIAIWLGARALTSWMTSVMAIVPMVVALLLALSIFSGFAGQVKQDQSYYNAASSLRRAYIASIHRVAPKVPPGSEIVLANFAEVIGPPTDRWYGTFFYEWDSTAIVDLLYHTASIVAVPMDRGSTCGKTALRIPVYHLAIPYGKLIVIDIGSQQLVRLAGRAACRAMLPSLYVTQDVY